MKIPKYVDKMIERRKLALELMDVSVQLEGWLENNGLIYLKWVIIPLLAV